MGGLFMFILFGGAMTLHGLCYTVHCYIKKKSLTEGLAIFSLGLVLALSCSKIFYDAIMLHGSEQVTEPRLVQSERFETGQAKQFIINEHGKKEYLDANYWRPENTYYKIAYRETTFFWFYDYEERDIEYFTVPKTEEN